jgi:hypothetical protein
MSPVDDKVSAEFIKYGEKILWEEIDALIDVMYIRQNARELENCNYVCHT